MGKTNYYLTVQLYKDLLKAYSKVCGTCWTQMEAYERVVKLPAPRFYISEKQAYQVISKMLKGDFSSVNRFEPNRRRMYYDLLNKTMELSEKRGYIGKPLCYVVRYAVKEPAPEFYMEPLTFLKIYNGLKNGTIREDGRRLPRIPRDNKDKK